MCLIKAHRFPKISRKPIIVYKQFIKCDNGWLKTPYRNVYCKCGYTIKASKPWYKGCLENRIVAEGVHAYIPKKSIDWSPYYDKIYCICEIPPFTPYWIGKYGDIATSKMKIIKQLEEKLEL